MKVGDLAGERGGVLMWVWQHGWEELVFSCGFIHGKTKGVEGCGCGQLPPR